MKRKQLLTKTFLIAAMLCMGMSVSWGQTTTTLMEYGTSDVAWTTARLAEWTAGGNPAFDDNENPTYVGISGSNGSYATSKTISPTSGNIINVTAVWRGSSGLGRGWNDATPQNNASYFRFGNIVVGQNDQTKKHGYIFTGLDNMKNCNQFSAGSYRVDITSSTWLKIEMEINTATNTLTSFSVKSEDGNTTYASASSIALTSPDYTTVAFGYHKAGSVQTSNAEQLKSIKITQTTQPVSYANYTVHFVDNNGATVKDDAVRNGEVGTTVNANSADQETFTSGDYKYTFKNDGGGVEVTNDGSAEFTVTYDKHEKYTYNVYAVNSNSEKLQDDPIATSTVFDDETASVKWSKYLKIGEQWYSTSETTFSTTATETGSKNVVYSSSDVDYFFEFENLSRSGGYNIVTESANSYSNGLRGRISGASTLYTSAIAGGVYTLTMPWANSNGTGTPNKVFVHTRNNGTNSDAIATLETSLSSNGTFTAVITVPDGYSIAFTGDHGSSNSQARIDYVTLTPYKVSVTISSSGYTSLSSAYALDFSGVDGLTAFVVKDATSNGVTLSSVDEAPAATGLILKGTPEKTYSIPAIVSAAEPATNLLSAAVTATEVEDGSVYILKGGNFCLLKGAANVAARTIPAGKAYLPKDKVTTSKVDLAVAFEEETVTGIESVQEFKGSKVQSFYDLQGRRVSQPTKGMYIMDGKKVVVK